MLPSAVRGQSVGLYSIVEWILLFDLSVVSETKLMKVQSGSVGETVSIGTRYHGKNIIQGFTPPFPVRQWRAAMLRGCARARF